MPFAKLSDMKKWVLKEVEKLKKCLDDNEDDYLDITAENLIKFLTAEKEADFQGPAIAFFADFDNDYAKGFRLSSKPEPTFLVDKEAHIARLALELDEFEPIGIIMLDASWARILISAGEVLQDAQDIKTKIHHLSKVGGWSQMRYQRRRDKEVKHFSKDVAEKATRIFEAEDIKRVVLAGRERMMIALKEEFHQKFNIIAEVNWDLAMKDNLFKKKVEQISIEAELKSEEKILKIFESEIKKRGLAAAGYEDVLKALHLGQVEVLIISPNIEAQQKERLISLAESTSATVEFTKLNSILDKNENIGAILRYKF